MEARIYVETSILVGYLDSQFNNKKDLKEFFRMELPRARSLRESYEFTVLETVVGEAIGQACVKGWDVVTSLEKLNNLINTQLYATIIRMFCDTMACDKVFYIAEKIRELEWKEYTWGMDLYDIWIVAQALCDPASTVLWTKDGRIQESYAIDMVQEKLIEKGIRKNELKIVESLYGID